jgi:hypothetical protein
MTALDVALYSGWAMAGVFLVAWLVTLQLRAHVTWEATEAARFETRCALDFLIDVAAPETGDLFAAIESFFRPWVRGDMVTVRINWPEWIDYRAIRKAAEQECEA